MDLPAGFPDELAPEAPEALPDPHRADEFRWGIAALDAWDGVRPAGVAGVDLPASGDAVAGKLVVRAPGVRALAETRSARRAAPASAAAPCKPDAAQSGERSCVAAELPERPASLAQSSQREPAVQMEAQPAGPLPEPAVLPLACWPLEAAAQAGAPEWTPKPQALRSAEGQALPPAERPAWLLELVLPEPLVASRQAGPQSAA